MARLTGKGDPQQGDCPLPAHETPVEVLPGPEGSQLSHASHADDVPTQDGAVGPNAAPAPGASTNSAGVPTYGANEHMRRASSEVTQLPLMRHSSEPSVRDGYESAQTSTAPPLDDRTVEAVKRGDPSSWEAAYLAYGRALMGFLMLRLDNQDDAADALSETFAHAIDKASSFRGDAYAFRAWLFSIARNVSVDQHRQRARLVALPDQPEVDDRVQPSGEDLAILGEDVVALRRGFATLPKDDQEVLWLRVCSRLSADEVGRVMGKKAGAVRMQQLRALEILRKRVQL